MKPRRDHRSLAALGLRRGLAWLVDCGLILLWALATAAVGVPLMLLGVTATVSPIALNLIGGAVIVLPATVGMAYAESGRWKASPGKRLLHLEVLDERRGGRVSPRSAVVRNLLKVTLPWVIAHGAVIAVVRGDDRQADAPAMLLLGLSYVIPIVYASSLLIGRGRTPYDLASHAVVVMRPGPSPVAVRR